MTGLIVAICLCGQAPAADPVAADVAIRAQQNREWFLSRFMVDMQMAGNYTPEAFAKVEEQVNKLPPERVNMMVEYYKQAKASQDQYKAQQQKVQQQMALNQAKLNLQRAQAYRDHLKREFDMKIASERQKVAQLNYSSRLANQMFWRSMNGGWGYPRYGRGYPYQGRVWSNGIHNHGYGWHRW